MTAAEVEDGGGGWQQRRMTTTAMADDNNGNDRQQQQQTTTAADNDSMQDWAVDYEGKGVERAANNNGMSPPGRECAKRRLFSVIRSVW
jgi:hypothetical protein